MPVDFDKLLASYAELAVRIGVNLQPGQRLLVTGPLANGGASLHAVPLARQIAAAAYKAGASLVEVLWGDEELQLSRFRYASSESFNQFSAWLPNALADHVHAGHAVLSITANDPDLLKEQPADRLAAVQNAVSQAVRPFRDHLSKNASNWSIIAAPHPAWAARVFPDVPAAEQVNALWDAIAKLVRLDQRDPIAAWERHLAALSARRYMLNERRYDALEYRGPGTNLRLGLVEGHQWVSGRSVSLQGISFAPNLPTEEVFTMPHRERVDGTVRSTKPLSYSGTLIEDFTITFKQGRAVSVTAARGEAVLKDLISADAGAARLGEVALVPHDSPVAQSGLLFYNTLFDENAASHVAFGSAYKFTIANGESMSDDSFEAAGGNRSVTHVDFMIGSSALDIDGICKDGTVEPLMRHGVWATPLER